MSDDELVRKVTELQDRQAILDCLTTYARAVDRLDRELLLSVYHDDAIDDHGMFVGGPKEFADWAIGMHKATHITHQHCILNHWCELDGDVAHAETYFMFVGINREGPPFVMSGGRYLDRLEKRDGRWAIAARLCVRDWAPVTERPDPNDPSTLTAIRSGLPQAARDLMRSSPQPGRDRRDPSYERPLMIDAERIRLGRAVVAAQQSTDAE